MKPIKLTHLDAAPPAPPTPAPAKPAPVPVPGDAIHADRVHLFLDGIHVATVTVTVYEEAAIQPPRPGYNSHFLRAQGRFIDTVYSVRSAEGGAEGAVQAFKRSIEERMRRGKVS
jgi:hypothetical protein